MKRGEANPNGGALKKKKSNTQKANWPNKGESEEQKRESRISSRDIDMRKRLGYAKGGYDSLPAGYTRPYKTAEKKEKKKEGAFCW